MLEIVEIQVWHYLLSVLVGAIIGAVISVIVHCTDWRRR